MSAVPSEAQLAQTLLELVRIESPIGEEAALCDYVEQRLRKIRGCEVWRDGHSLVAHCFAKPGAPKVALVGHLDTVRTEHTGEPRIESDKVYGAGAADMKSGLAVMLELAERMTIDSSAFDLYMVFYEREEGPYAENALGRLLENFPVLHTLNLAVCLEPSDNKLQLGCMGSIHASVTFEGRTSHSARPWQGENALQKSWRVLKNLSEREPVEVVIDGHRFMEVMSATIGHGGRSKNIIPDRFEININYRFGPTRSPSVAFSELVDFVGTDAVCVASDLSPGGRPHANDPLVLRLAGCGVVATETKQAWTDVARFDTVGVPGVNFGPGTQAQAHQRNEYTLIPPLAEGYLILHRFLGA